MITHDKNINNFFILWLKLTFVLVIAMIIIGGFTRLTGSGLSITEWELFKGILPPMSQSEWEYYFDLYKQIPQFKILNSDMLLNEFKIIFYWEYIHRIFGRFIGLFFLFPLLYFHFSKKIKYNELVRCYIILSLIIIQGIVGWYMVKSGLVNDITVSHYRLSLHLSIAILIVSILFWTIINYRSQNNKFFFSFSTKSFPYIFLTILIFFQIIMGAFVSGLDAGKIYQTWPLMGYSYFPDDFHFVNFFDFLNFENHSLVQFYHRNIAYIITLYILVLGFFILRKNDKKLFKPMLYLFLSLLLQVLIGIFTLISNLNIFLASAHQIVGVILVLSTLNLYYSTIK